MLVAALRHSEALWSYLPTAAILFTFRINLPYFFRPSPITITIHSEGSTYIPFQLPATLVEIMLYKRACPSVILSVDLSVCQAFAFRPTRSDLWPCIWSCSHTYETILCPIPFYILDCRDHCYSPWNWYMTGKKMLCLMLNPSLLKTVLAIQGMGKSRNKHGSANRGEKNKAVYTAYVARIGSQKAKALHTYRPTDQRTTAGTRSYKVDSSRLKMI